MTTITEVEKDIMTTVYEDALINEKPVIQKWVIDEEEEDHSKFCKKCDEKFEDWLNTDICDTCYEGLKNEEEEEEEAIQPHCYKCFNMNMSITVNCFTCDKLYCKSHSYCISGYDDDMPYCSKECFLNC
jgi:hypothetical protein